MNIILVGHEGEKSRFIKGLNAKYQACNHLGEAVISTYEAKVDGEQIFLSLYAGSINLLTAFDSIVGMTDMVIYLHGKPSDSPSVQNIQELSAIKHLHIEYYDREVDDAPQLFLKDAINEFRKNDSCGADLHQAQSLVSHSIYRKKPDTVEKTKVVTMDHRVPQSSKNGFKF